MQIRRKEDKFMKKKDLFWGLLFILAAVFIIVDKLGYFPQISAFKIVVTIILLAVMFKSIVRVKFAGILFPIAFICIIYAQQWNITAITPGPVLLTALLGSIGLSMIFKKNNYWYNHSWSHHEEEHFSQVIDEPDGNVVNCSASFGSSMKYVNTDNLQKANIKCSFGAMKVYFDKAVVSSGYADIYLDVSFSGVELYMPKTWKVVYDVNTTLGGIDEKNRNTGADSSIVTLRGNVSFGGVEIIYI